MAKHDYLIASGALGGDAARLLERVPKQVVMSALPWARAALLSLAVSLGLIAPFLPP
jgi:hypothetical protein